MAIALDHGSGQKGFFPIANDYALTELAPVEQIVFDLFRACHTEYFGTGPRVIPAIAYRT